MRGHWFEHAFDQRAGFERLVLWNRDVMFAIQLGREAHVRAVLPVKLITQNAQGFDQIVAVNVPWNFHDAKTSSRTKCSRMTEGIFPGTPSPK